MSRTIDEKIVSMQFDNRQFESNVKTSLSTLDKLKQSLKLDGASKGLENVNSAVKGFDVSPLSNGLETVKTKFSALEVIGVTALANITNSVVNSGKQLVKSLSLDQITAGWQKFGSKTTSVATLVAQGNDIKTVNKELDRLNWFTDETSYNFTDMVSNIAKFTASGKGLEDSVTAMEGIANWAALSGQNAQTASHAMYQLSQAMGAGVMRKEDYKSIQNASMDTDEFRQKCLDAGVALGTLKKTGEDTYKSLNGGKEAFNKSQFAEHLTEDAWFTSDVMMKVFTDYSNAVNKIYEVTEDKGMLASEVIDQIHKTSEKEGISIDEAIKKLGYVDEAGNQLFDSFGLKAFEAAQKARTWGDAVDSVKDAVSTGWMNTFEIIFGNAEEATQLWTDLANAMYDVFASGAEARNEMLQGWKDLGGRDDLIESFWNVWESIGSIITPIKEAFRDIFPATTAERLYDITAKLKEFTSHLKISDETADKLKRTFKGVFSVLDIFKKALTAVGGAILKLLGSEGMVALGRFLMDILAKLGDFFTKLNEGFKVSDLSGSLSKIVSLISDTLKGAVSGLGSFSDMFSKVGSVISKVASSIWESLKTVFGWIADNISVKGILGTLGSLFAFLSGKKLYESASSIKDFVESLFGKSDVKAKIKDQLTDLLDSVHESLQSFTSGIKVSSLLAIAAAIGILAASMSSISKLNAADVTKSLLAIGSMLTMLSYTLKSMNKTLSGTKTAGLVKAGASLILVAEAINILAKAMGKMADLSMGEIAKGLVGIGGGMAELCIGLKALNKVKVPLRTSVAMLALAESCSILGDAMKKFSDLQWNEIGRGLTAMGGALAELVVSLTVLNKFGGGKSLVGSLGILVVVQSLSKMADGLKKFGEMSWDEIKHGLVGMGGALTELAVVVGALGKLAGMSGIVGAASILIAVQSLSKLATEFKNFGSMSWDEIKRGLVGMGGALLEVAGMTGALGKLAGFSGLLGAGTILLAVQGLGDLADAFGQFGDMSWDEIKRGLVGMGGALTEVGVISGGLGYLTNFAGLLGSGSLLLAIQGLGDLADAFKKFGEMSWDEIGRGLSAMGGALSETALGGLLNTFSGFGAAAISEMSSSLGTLADSLKKWKDVTVPDHLASQLGSLASGVNSFMFSGMGADALTTVAPGIGAMADSVRKWDGVTVPDGIGFQLSSLANGINMFTFSGLGAGAIATAAPAVGTMADSVRKWSGVTVPEGLGTQLLALAKGINSFTFSGLGAGAIATAAPAVGSMADSVKKWNGIKVPEGIGDGLKDIAKGVKAFSFAFLGGWSIAAIVQPLKDLAGSVKKWNGIKIPDDLSDQLTSLASGVKSFTFAFLGGWSMSAIVEPLGNLAGSVKKWNGVSIPEDLGSSLSTLADGVSSFAGIGDVSGATSSIDSIASSVSKLSSANYGAISAGFSTLITSITNLGTAGSSISGVADQVVNTMSSMMTRLASAISSSSGAISSAFSNVITMALNSISGRQESFYVVGVSSMQRFAAGLMAGSANVSAPITTMMQSITARMTSSQGLFQTAGQALMHQFQVGLMAGSQASYSAVSNVLTRVTSYLSSNQARFYQAGANLMTGFNNGLISSGGRVNTSVLAIISRASSAIRARQQLFYSAGVQLMTRLVAGLRTNASAAQAAVRTAVSGCASAIKTKYQSFYSAGVYLVDGFASGIKAETFAAEAAAAAMAEAAKEAAEEALGIGSPSKVFRKIGVFTVEGFANGIDAKSSLAKNSITELASNTIDAFKNVFKIHSPSVVMKKNGEYVVKGLAEGIKKNTTAEEAATKKAQNIVSAFKKELDKLSLDRTTSDLEYSLWEAANGDTTTRSELINKKTELLTKKIKSQTDTVNMAKAEYAYTCKVFGETSKEAQEAYNKLLQEQTNLVSLQKELDTVTETSFQNVLDKIDKSYQKEIEASTQLSSIVSQYQTLYNNLFGNALNNSTSTNSFVKGMTAVVRTASEASFSVAQMATMTTRLNAAQKRYNDLCAAGANTEELVSAYQEILSIQNELVTMSNSLGDALNLSDVGKSMLSTFSLYLSKNWPEVEQTIGKLTKSLVPYIESLNIPDELKKDLIGAFENFDLSSIVDKTVRKILDVLANGELLGAFNNFFSKVLNMANGFSNSLVTLMKSLFSSNGTISQLLTGLTAKFSTAIQGTSTKSKGILSSLLSLVTGVGKKVATGAKGLLATVSSALSKLGGTKIGLIATAITGVLGLGTAFAKSKKQAQELKQEIVTITEQVDKLAEAQSRYASLVAAGASEEEIKSAYQEVLSIQQRSADATNRLNEAQDKYNELLNSGTADPEELEAAYRRVVLIQQELNDIQYELRETTETITGDMTEVGENVGNGLLGGLASVGKKVWNGVKSVGSKIVNGFKSFFGIHSPSRVFMEIGKQLNAGLGVGLEKYANIPTSSINEVGSGIVASATTVLSGISDVLNGDLDAHPTIRPVVDMDSLNGSKFNLAADLDASMVQPISMLSQLITDVQHGIETSNSEVISAINDLRSDLSAFYDGDDKEIAFYVDGKKLASTLAKPMNRELAIISKKEAILMGYPDLPKNRVIVDGVDLTEKFKMVLLDGYVLKYPEPKTYIIDIPCGNGPIDLTESLMGDVAYKNRDQEFTFAVINVEDFEKVKTQVSSLLHGRAFDYQLTMDPEYTYHGRFTIDDCSHSTYESGIVGVIKVKVDASPFKHKPTQVLKADAVGGKIYYLESGRERVRPVFETDGFLKVIFKGKLVTLPQGVWTINDLMFTVGTNELYLSSYDIRNLTWGQVKAQNITWGQFKEKRLFEWYKINGPGSIVTDSWSHLADKTWAELNATPWKLLTHTVVPELNVREIYVKYEWGDL